MKLIYGRNLDEFTTMIHKTEQAKQTLLNKTGEGAEMTGWVTFPSEITTEHLFEIKKLAADIKKKSNILVVVGIGGSYLGTKAVVDTIHGYFHESYDFRIYYAGYTLSATYMHELLDFLDDKDFCVNYVSKSGTTLEPAIAFRMLKNLLKQQHGDKYNEYIYVTTDPDSGNALEEAKANNYTILSIPKNIGGRYSVFTDGSLLPLAVAGMNINKFIEGAQNAQKDCREQEFKDNVAMRYALCRTINYLENKKIEILCVNTVRMRSVANWYEQLFGESEGKDGKGIFPTSLVYSTSLHSLGQYIQDGSRILFETFIKVNKSRNKVTVVGDEEVNDPIKYVVGNHLEDINNTMTVSTILAHAKSGAPNIILEVDEMDEFNLGYFMYTFMFACGISAYLLKVNPFDQPAVQEYKNNMFALLGRPGYEDLRKDLEEKLKGYDF